MSPSARRYFGCFLPLLLAVFGCGSLFLVGYAGRVVFQFERMPSADMAPLIVEGWTVMINNSAYWADEPGLGDIVTVDRPDGWRLRRIVGLPGETVAVEDGAVLVDGEPRDVGYAPIGRGPDAPPVELGPGEYYVLADNREADDSRVWGPIERMDIFGRAIFQIDRELTFHEVMITPTPATRGE